MGNMSEMKNRSKFSVNDIMDQSDILTMIEDEDLNDLGRVLVSLCYQSGGRISEVLEIRKCDINFYKVKGKEFLKIKLNTKKNPNQDIRHIPVPIYRDIENRISKYYIDRMRTLENNDLIYPLKYTTAWKTISKILDKYKKKAVEGSNNKKEAIGKTEILISKDGKEYRGYKSKKDKGKKFMNACHYLRHCRLTHMVLIYDYNEPQLTKFAGWTDSQPATTYVHLKTDDLEMKML